MLNNVGRQFNDDFEDQLVNTTTYGFQSGPEVSSLNNGGKIIVWTSNTLFDSKMVGQLYDADGNSVGSEFVIASSSCLMYYEPAVETLENGNFIVSYFSENGRGTKLITELYTESGDQISRTIVDRKVRPFFDRETYDIDFNSTITALDDGAYMVTWQDGRRIKTKVYDENGKKIAKFQPIKKVIADSEIENTILENGTILQTWTNLDRSTKSTEIFARIIDTSGTVLKSQFMINSDTELNQNDASVTALSNGGFAVVWKTQKFDKNSIAPENKAVEFQIFDADGIAVTAAINLYNENEFSLGEDTDPIVEALPDGTLIVLWIENQEIKGKRFDENGLIIEEYVHVAVHENINEFDISVNVDSSISLVWETRHDNDRFSDIYSTTIDAYQAPLLSSGEKIDVIKDVDVNAGSIEYQFEDGSLSSIIEVQNSAQEGLLEVSVQGNILADSVDDSYLF